MSEENVQEVKPEEATPQVVSTTAEEVAADLVQRVPALRGNPGVEVLAAVIALNTSFPQDLKWIIEDRDTVMSMIQASPKGWDDMAIGNACRQVLDVVDAARKELADRFAQEAGDIKPGTDYKAYEQRFQDELKEQGDHRALVTEVQTAISRVVITLKIPLEEVGKVPEKPSGWSRFRSTAQILATRAGHAFYVPTPAKDEVPVVAERPGWQTEPILKKNDPELRQLLGVVNRMIETKNLSSQAILTRLAALDLGIENLKALLQSLADKTRRQEAQCSDIEERAKTEFTAFQKALANTLFVRELAFLVSDFILPETAQTQA